MRVYFIQDLRKEVKQPKMPFVIAVLGTPAFPEGAMANNVANAQREAVKSPELTGTVAVAAVESWPLTTPEVAIRRMRKDAAQGNPAETEKADMQWRSTAATKSTTTTAAAASSSASARNAPTQYSSSWASERYPLQSFPRKRAGLVASRS